MDALTCLKNYSDSDSSGEDTKEKPPAKSRSKSSNIMDRDQKRSRSRSPNRRERNESSRRKERHERRSRSPRSSSERHSDRRHHDSDRHHDRYSDRGSHSRRDRDGHHSSSRRSETKSEEQSSRHKQSPQPAKEDDGTAYTNDPDLTPEQKLEKALAARQAQAPKLPSYMNPGAANPSKLMATHQKRKLLWSKDKKERSWNNWESASFDDGGQGDKFRKLMGIKTTPSSTGDSDSKQQQKNAKLMQDLEVQYETSRFMTHKARGAGLGYGMSTQTLEPKIDQSTDNLLESSDRRQ